MKKIFTGPINTLHIKSLSLKDNGLNLIKEDLVLKKDALYYQNFFGKMVNFEHNTCLLSKEEAEDYFKNFDSKVKEHNITVEECSILYFNEEELEFVKSISNEEFKALKKSFSSRKK